MTVAHAKEFVAIPLTADSTAKCQEILSTNHRIVLARILLEAAKPP